MRRLVISRTAARTRMELPMYRMVAPMPPVERGQKASPLGVRSHALGRKLSAKQTGRRPSVSVRGPLTLASRLYRGRGARRSVWGGPLPSRLRRATFPIGGRLRNALRPASIRVVFKVDDITLSGRYQSQTEPSLATRMVVSLPPVERRTNHHYLFVPSAQRTVPACSGAW